jgi:hypothetical protein
MREIEEGQIAREKTSGEKFFDSAIGTYEQVIDRYATDEQGVYGRRAFDNAIDLAKRYENDVVRARLMREYIELMKERILLLTRASC